MICGQKEETIRKHYFKGKIPKLLIDIQASGEYTPEEFTQLNDYLQELKDRDNKLNLKFEQFIPQIDNSEEDSILDELNQESLSEAEIKDLEREKKNRDNSVIIASKLIRELFTRFYSPSIQSPTKEQLMDMSFEMLSLLYYIDREDIYRESLYRKKIVEYERAGKQRKLAEEYAKGGIEYRKWMLSQSLKNQIDGLINLTKKRYPNFQ